MPYDPYVLCPCGSGKKLKFCCQAIADDMERINRMIEGNQLRGALHQLEALDRRQPGNEWITMTRALLLIQTDEVVAARDLLKPWAAAHPDSELAWCLYAVAQLSADGYEAAKKTIQRAFQKGAKSQPMLVSNLAAAIATEMAERGERLAERELLSLALRLSTAKDRKEIFSRLMELDGDCEECYPLRSVHPLPSVHVPEDCEKEYKKGMKLAMIGCWDAAADIFASLAQKLPDKPELLFAAGLCRAWDGDSPRAAELLHQAAEGLSDFPTAVEAEVLAQLLDQKRPGGGHALVMVKSEVSSVSRLLSVLDEQPRLVRKPTSDASEKKAAARYRLLDRPKLSDRDVPTLTRDAIPRVIANIVVYDATSDSPGVLMLTAFRGARLEQGREHLLEIAGELLSLSEEPTVIHTWPDELRCLHWDWELPPQTPLPVRLRLQHEEQRRVWAEDWTEQPQAALLGKSPREAAGDPKLRVKVTAAVYVLDALADQSDQWFDPGEMLASLGLEPLPPLRPDPDVAITALSLLQLHRLDPASLTDEQLASVLNRAYLTRHSRFLHVVLEEVVRRPAESLQLVETDLTRAYIMLIDLLALKGDGAEALRKLAEARSRLLGELAPFDEVFRWDIRELMLRFKFGPEAALESILQKFFSYYVPKIPDLRGILESLLKDYGADLRLSAPAVLTPETAAASPHFGPEREATAAGKLWLPGQ